MNKLLCINSFLFFSYLIIHRYMNKIIKKTTEKDKSTIISMYAKKQGTSLLFTIIISVILIFILNEYDAKINVLDIFVFTGLLLLCFINTCFCFKEIKRIESRFKISLDMLETGSIFDIFPPFIITAYILIIINMFEYEFNIINFIIYIFTLIILSFMLSIVKKWSKKNIIYMMSFNLIIHIFLIFIFS